ncbi:hypothetical protein ACYSNO_06670 [Enterococcus sp. LJL98]
MNKKILSFFLLTFFILSSTSIVNANTINFETNNFSEENITPLADIIGWRYKTENGKLYKRQFNYSKDKWIGDWILVN